MHKQFQKIFGRHIEDDRPPLPIGLSRFGKRALEKRLRDEGFSKAQATKIVSIVSAYFDERDAIRDV